jgi:ligand-binding sensor protein
VSCNCGCHDDKAPATGWKRFVPLIVAAAVVGVLIAGAVLKKNDADKATARSTAERMTTATTP